MSSAQHQILVVDDEEMIRDSLVEFLDEHGYQAVGAVNGQDALQKLGGLRPCLIILDLMMPVMDGHAFRQQQLSDPELSTIPVLILSAYHDVAKSASALAVADHLSKPLKLHDLLMLVQKHCPNEEA